jgi:hypothetical protein
VWDKVQEELQELQVEVEAGIKIISKLSLAMSYFLISIDSRSKNPKMLERQKIY